MPALPVHPATLSRIVTESILIGSSSEELMAPVDATSSRGIHRFFYRCSNGPTTPFCLVHGQVAGAYFGGAEFGLTGLAAGVAFLAGLPFANTIRTNLSKFSNSDLDGFGIVILVRGRINGS